MWTNENRGRYDRSRLRYPSDLTDDEWNLVECLIPPGKRGDKRTVIMREVVNGLMYILSTGCQWRAIPKDLPPRSTLYDYFDLWSWDGTLDRIHHELYMKCREANGEIAEALALLPLGGVGSEDRIERGDERAMLEILGIELVHARAVVGGAEIEVVAARPFADQADLGEIRPRAAVRTAGHAADDVGSGKAM